ncbi:MAG TPA: PepSY domain-containing protein [Methylophaga sp.]|nr:PepSY domain-containing protein [Methylophaga sp.]
MIKTFKLLPLAALMSVSATAFAEDNYDLDDIRGWDLVPMEACLDAALDTIRGNARKLEMKMEGDDPTYEFDIEATADGHTYNVECNAEEGFVTEVEREAQANDPVFEKYAKISEADARKIALDFVPGDVVSMEYEVSMEGNVAYEYDIVNAHGREYKVDVNAATGKIEEANLELYEIGAEKEM